MPDRWLSAVETGFGFTAGGVMWGLLIWGAIRLVKGVAAAPDMKRTVLYTTFGGSALLTLLSGFSGSPTVDIAPTEESMLNVPVLQALKQYEPTAYEEVRKIVKAGLANRTPASEIRVLSQKLVDEQIARRLPSASNDTLRRHLAITLDAMEQLYAKGDDTCFMFLYPTAVGAPVALPGNVKVETLEAHDALGIELMRSPNSIPSPLPSVAQLAPALERIDAALAQKYSEAERKSVEAPNTQVTTADRRKVCAIVIDWNREVAKLPPDMGTQVMRLMVSAK